MATRAQSSGRLRFDSFEVDVLSSEIFDRGVRLRLQEQPFQILRVLLERPGELVTREELKRMLWPGDTFGDFDDGLNTAVKKIRDLLGDSAERPRYIETVPRRGYRFIATVVSQPQSESASPQPSQLDHQAIPLWRKLLRPGAYALLGISALVLIFLGGFGAWRQRRTGSPPAPHIGALAVLPLDDLSIRGTDEDYFADGITDELITQLAQLPALRVISRTSAMQYKNARKPLPQIARELGVDAILEGSVTRSGGRVRVTAQLIDARSDTHLWSAEYSREMRDILSLQREVTADIAGQIRSQFLAPQKARLQSAPTVDPEAYDLFLKGLYFWDQRNVASFKQAIEYFRQSTRRDASFPPAWAYLSASFCGSEFYGVDSSQANYPQALQSAQKALQLDPMSPEAHAAMGCIHNIFEWNWVQAESEFQTAITINPNYELAHQWYCFTLIRIGQPDKAIQETKRAIALDPISLRVNVAAALDLMSAHYYQDAIKQYQVAIELYPQQGFLHRGLAEAYEKAGRLPEAAQEFEKFLDSDEAGRTFRLACHPFEYSRCKQRFAIEEAQRELADLQHKQSKGGYVSPAAYASAYLRLGNKSEAIHWLQVCYDQHSSYLLSLQLPEFDTLRSQPQFQALVAKVGWPQTP